MVVVIDSTDLDLGKHAYSQMKDFGVDPEVIQTEALDVPRIISRTEEEVLLIMRTDTEFSEQIVGKVLDLEEKKYVEKVFLEKSGGREVFQREARRETREKAEKLAEEV
jgi:hypothetical protein